MRAEPTIESAMTDLAELCNNCRLTVNRALRATVLTVGAAWFKIKRCWRV
jgi:hypothetical protein